MDWAGLCSTCVCVFPPLIAMQGEHRRSYGQKSSSWIYSRSSWPSTLALASRRRYVAVDASWKAGAGNLFEKPPAENGAAVAGMSRVPPTDDTLLELNGNGTGTVSR